MITAITGRVFTMLLTAFIVLVVIFVLIQLLPGDPVAALLGPDATSEDINRLRTLYGLDRPIVEQLGAYLQRVVRGDFGTSIAYQMPVLSLIQGRVETTLWLALTALVVMLVIGIPFGVIAAVCRGTWIDQGLLLFALVGVSVPTFWLGLLLMQWFAAGLGWLPSSGFRSIVETWNLANIRYMILPGLTLGLAESALLARITRSNMLDVLSMDYINTARGKGLASRTVVMRHAFRNASVGIITVFGFTFAKLFSGAVVTETVFALPGIGRLVVESVLSRDYPVIQALLVIIALLYLLINALTDILYSVLDPRLRYQ